MTEATLGSISYAGARTRTDDGEILADRKCANNRAAWNEANVARYHQQMLDMHQQGIDYRESFPPVAATRGGGYVFLYDGEHRLRAHCQTVAVYSQSAGSDEASRIRESEPFPCAYLDYETEEDAYRQALLLAGPSDMRHGVRLNRADVGAYFAKLVAADAIDPADTTSIVDLTGCSLRHANRLTEPYRDEKTLERDQAIAADLATGASIRSVSEKHHTDRRSVAAIQARGGAFGTMAEMHHPRQSSAPSGEVDSSPVNSPPEQANTRSSTSSDRPTAKPRRNKSGPVSSGSGVANELSTLRSAISRLEPTAWPRQLSSATPMEISKLSTELETTLADLADVKSGLQRALKELQAS